MRDRPDDYSRGREQSVADRAAGNATIFWGTRGSWGELFARLMSERFGVRVEHLDCFTTEAKASFERGYNDATLEHIAGEYGSGAFQGVRDEVDEYRKQS